MGLITVTLDGKTKLKLMASNNEISLEETEEVADIIRCMTRPPYTAPDVVYGFANSYKFGDKKDRIVLTEDTVIFKGDWFSMILGIDKLLERCVETFEHTDFNPLVGHETCIVIEWVTCPECNGKGGHVKLEKDGRELHDICYSCRTYGAILKS